MRIEFPEFSKFPNVAYAIELQIRPTDIKDNLDSSSLSGLVKIFDNDQHFRLAIIIIDKLDCLPYIRLTANYDDVTISVKYDLCTEEKTLCTEVCGKEVNKTFPIQEKLCEYVIELANSIDSTS